ncbi:MAG: prepilin-type N-terminal cleavage/methylation domain-containing protein [Rhodospirillaceae bacterium]|nr:prepilin-type N-terminal cleavage/methylation domain-containing protein [Rhodospirillaceae bacterium]
MSVSLQSSSPATDSAGFTLLEVLVVLAILGLAAAAVGPRLAAMYDSIAFAMTRETLEQDLSALPYQAFVAGTDMVLGETPKGAQLADGAVPATLVLPDGWNLDVPQPIWFRASGFCSGGTVVVTVGEISETYILRAPQCRAEAAP